MVKGRAQLVAPCGAFTAGALVRKIVREALELPVDLKANSPVFDSLRSSSENRDAFNRLIWTIVSPKWHFDDATYERTAAAFNNPDHVAIVIHNYRWRLGLAKGDPKYDDLEARLFSGPAISVPTITIASDFDGPAANGAAYRSKFTGKYSHRILPGIGHNVPQEAPQAFADAVIAVEGY